MIMRFEQWEIEKMKTKKCDILVSVEGDFTEEEKRMILKEEFSRKMAEMNADIEIKRMAFTFGENEYQDIYFGHLKGVESYE